MNEERTPEPEPDRALATLVILSEVDTADELAAAVGLPPDEAWNRGEPRKTRGLRHKFSGVEYCSRLPRTARPEEHLDDLLVRLAPVKERIAELSLRLAAQGERTDLARVTVSHMTSNGTPGYDFSPEQVALIGELGVWFGLSLYVADDADCGDK